MNRTASEKRQKRRKNDLRIKAKAARFARINGIAPEKYVRIADHLQTCSGLCCGNRRRYEGRGLNELRHLESMREAVLADA